MYILAFLQMSLFKSSIGFELLELPEATMDMTEAIPTFCEKCPIMSAGECYLRSCCGECPQTCFLNPGLRSIKQSITPATHYITWVANLTECAVVFHVI